MFEESQLAVERINGVLATEATILHAVMATAVSAFGTKGSAQKANAALTKLIKELSGDG